MSGCGCSELYVGNDMPVTLEGLHNSLNGASITDASVVAEVLDTDGNTVGTQVVLVYEVATDRYVGIIEASTPLVAQEVYFVRVVADHVDGYEGRWLSEPIIAENRGFC